MSYKFCQFYEKFIDAVNNGDLHTVEKFLNLGFDIKLAELLQNSYIFSDKNIAILELLFKRGMKLTVSYIHSLLSEGPFVKIFKSSSKEDLKRYINGLIRKYRVGEYLVNLALSFKILPRLDLHIYFSEKLLDLVETVPSDTILFLLEVLIIEANVLLRIKQQTNDVNKVLDQIYDAIAKVGIVTLHYIPDNIRADGLADMILELEPKFKYGNHEEILSEVTEKLRQYSF